MSENAIPATKAIIPARRVGLSCHHIISPESAQKIMRADMISTMIAHMVRTPVSPGYPLET